jgi:hypothetical protein
VPPAGEPVAELLARIGRQAGLIREYRDREVAQDAVVEAPDLLGRGFDREDRPGFRPCCRVHSCVITIRLNAVPPMQAVRGALAGHAWTLLRDLRPA